MFFYTHDKFLLGIDIMPWRFSFTNAGIMHTHSHDTMFLDVTLVDVTITQQYGVWKP